MPATDQSGRLGRLLRANRTFFALHEVVGSAEPLFGAFDQPLKTAGLQELERASDMQSERRAPTEHSWQSMPNGQVASIIEAVEKARGAAIGSGDGYEAWAPFCRRAPQKPLP